MHNTNDTEEGIRESQNEGYGQSNNKQKSSPELVCPQTELGEMPVSQFQYNSESTQFNNEILCIASVITNYEPLKIKTQISTSQYQEDQIKPKSSGLM